MHREKTTRSLSAVGATMLIVFCFSQACADDPRCKVPPFGMSESDFRSFVETFGGVIVPTKTLPALCNAKFGGADRTGLYNLGFTDQDINSKNMGDLALQFIVSLKNFADKTR
jgi:hypothetical protein